MLQLWCTFGFLLIRNLKIQIMITLKLLFGWGLVSFMLLGCYAQVIIEDPAIVDLVETAGSILNS